MIRLARNLVDTAFVATSFELGGKEDFNQFNSLLCGDIVGWQTEDISIVVLTSEASEWFVPTERSTNALVVVASHGDTIACRADSYTHIVGAVLYRSRHRVSEVGVVAAVGRWAAVIGNLYALLCEPSDNSLFECKACVIRSNAEMKMFHMSVVLCSIV